MPPQAKHVLLLMRGAGVQHSLYLEIGTHQKQHGWLTAAGRRIWWGLTGWMPVDEAVEALGIPAGWEARDAGV